MNPLFSYSEYPTESFPPVISSFISEYARGSGSQESFVGTSVLACACGLVDGSSIEIKHGYVETPNLFLAIVGKAGVAKSPPMKASLRPLMVLDARKHERYMVAKENYDEKRKKVFPKPLAEDAPVREPSKMITDGTMEGLIAQLEKFDAKREPTHAVYMRDELKGFFSGMDKYKGGSGGDDYQTWLTLYSGGPVSRVLKGGTIYIPDARSTVIGGIQPEIYDQVMQDRGDGMIDRFMVAYYNGEPSKTDIYSSIDNKVTNRYVDEMLSISEDSDVAYSIPSSGRVIQDAIQDFHNMASAIGAQYDVGAFKKWEQNLYRVCCLLARLHGDTDLTISVVEKAKDLCAYYALGWLQAHLRSDQDLVDENEEKVLLRLKQAGSGGSSIRQLCQTIRNFRGKGGSERARSCIGLMVTKGTVSKSKHLYFYRGDLK